ncbi:MAG TPA: proteasome ATPase, partial [Cellulomonas sp.]|nr:proteasome ATPase [Cellulomonas sp.]
MTEPTPGRELHRELAVLAAKNERLSDALLAAREQIVELKRQVDDLAKPPGTYATFL